MTKKQKIALVVYGALFLLITKVRNVIRNLGFRFNGISVLSTDVENNTSQVAISLLLRNSLPFSVTVDAIAGDVYLQGVQAATINQAINTTITANSITPVTVIATLRWLGVADGVRANILSGDIRNLNIQLVGTITAEGRSFNVAKTITYYDLV